jgi:hypothetical protein
MKTSGAEIRQNAIPPLQQSAGVLMPVHTVVYVTTAAVPLASPMLQELARDFGKHPAGGGETKGQLREVVQLAPPLETQKRERVFVHVHVVVTAFQVHSERKKERPTPVARRVLRGRLHARHHREVHSEHEIIGLQDGFERGKCLILERRHLEVRVQVASAIDETILARALLRNHA